MPIQPQIKILEDASMALLNVRQNKAPIFDNYLIDGVEILLQKFNPNINTPYGYAIRMGYNDITKYTFISLDFDCCKKDEKTDKYIDCKNTVKLLEKYQEEVNSQDGMFESSTTGNCNIIVNITNSQTIIDLLKEKPACWSAYNHNLEILQHKIQVIPPTSTKCKKNNIIRPRRWVSDNLIYNVKDDNDNMVEFIKSYFELPSKKSTKKEYQTKSFKEMDKKFEENQDSDDGILCKDNLELTKKLLTKTKLKELSYEYESWWKIGYALYNIHGSKAQDIFVAFSTNKKYRSTDAMIKYWNNNICSFEKVNKQYKSMNSWYIIKLLKINDYDGYCNYIEEIFDDLEKYKKLEIKIMVEDPDGDIRLAKIYFGGENYLIWNRYKEKMEIVTWSMILHILNERVGKEFLNYWNNKDTTKKAYDAADFLPYQNFTPRKSKKEPNIFNLFNGFKYHGLIENPDYVPNVSFIKHFQEYISRVCSYEKKASDFVEQNFAWICFKGRPNICLVIYGGYGSGKTSLTILINNLIGKEYCKEDYDTKNGLFKNFNSAFEGKIMVFINEPDWNSFTNSMGIFKHTITDDTLRIEKKGMDAYDVSNYATYWITTNNRNLFNQEKDDRRFFFVNCEFNGYTPQEKSAYFKDFYENKVHNEEYLTSVLWYLKNKVLDHEYNFEIKKKECATTYHKIICDTYKDNDITEWLCFYLQKDNKDTYWKKPDNELVKIDVPHKLQDHNIFWINIDTMYDSYKGDNTNCKITSKDLFLQEIKMACYNNDITYRATNDDGTRTKYINIMGYDIKERMIKNKKWVDM